MEIPYPQIKKVKTKLIASAFIRKEAKWWKTCIELYIRRNMKSNKHDTHILGRIQQDKSALISY